MVGKSVQPQAPPQEVAQVQRLGLDVRTSAEAAGSEVPQDRGPRHLTPWVQLQLALKNL